MEFYRNKKTNGNNRQKFQFPTGWNSTHFFIDARFDVKIVSIPNGMEFYRYFYSLFLHLACFNSQRDGILRRSRVYNDTYVWCFNSQRDGILHKLYKADSCGRLEFQFPTGWNSTFVNHLENTSIFNVSIPNGMEFYLLREKFRDGKWCFNSQRDGILPTSGKI